MSFGFASRLYGRESSRSFFFQTSPITTRTSLHSSPSSLTHSPSAQGHILSHRHRTATPFYFYTSRSLARGASGDCNIMNKQNTKKTQWPKLTLYGDLNMRPFRNIWMLEEIGLPYEHVLCKPWSRVAKSVHPLGKVPALLVEYCKEDNDTTVEKQGSDVGSIVNEGRNNAGETTAIEIEDEKFVVLESAAINTFLGDLARELSISNAENQHQQQNLPILVPPPATPQRAKYDSLTMFVMTELDSQSLWIHRKHFDLPDVFGEAPIAVREARRQFDGALDAMVALIITRDRGDVSDDNNDDSNIVNEDEGNDNDNYLLSTGFSAADLIFASCCFWAQQIGWLGWTVEVSDDATTKNDENNENASSEMQNDGNEEKTITGPKPLVPKLAAYLKQCRSRPAFVRANELRKKQVYVKKEIQTSKL